MVQNGSGDAVKNSDEVKIPDTDSSDLIMRITQSEYEVKGMNLSSFIDKTLFKKLEDALGEIGMMNIAFVLLDKKGFVNFSHKTYHNYKEDILTINTDDTGLKTTLAEILDIKEE